MKVSFDDLKPGMVLAAALVDDGGRLLLPTGIALTEKHLRFFQMWGIAEADIAGDDRTEREPDTIDPERLAAAAVEVKPYFRHADPDHPVMVQLLRHCTMLAARRRA
jgi:hypothetical protein